MSPSRKRYKKHSKIKKVSGARGLGFIPLNRWFKGGSAHHINENLVIFIPHNIHKKITHNVRTGMGMEKINKYAIEFLFKTEIGDEQIAYA
jgi:hypothetical protein